LRPWLTYGSLHDEWKTVEISEQQFSDQTKHRTLGATAWERSWPYKARPDSVHKLLAAGSYPLSEESLKTSYRSGNNSPSETGLPLRRIAPGNGLATSIPSRWNMSPLPAVGSEYVAYEVNGHASIANLVGNDSFATPATQVVEPHQVSNQRRLACPFCKHNEPYYEFIDVCSNKDGFENPGKVVYVAAYYPFTDL
jgi:hypothetical protein